MTLFFDLRTSLLGITQWVRVSQKLRFFWLSGFYNLVNLPVFKILVLRKFSYLCEKLKMYFNGCYDINF
ncbi:hypothetical protein BpHYR1_038240 [Brachionus plicatilis]|uniref:Uncharacterized protein n=1 Tax=Brachionus plicatilis TaxID=10195 RepID=A0A3M7PIC4_BRAPC|nr:hypothetical protein BpHYR1_038240 [Brachionus plicatilis]